MTRGSWSILPSGSTWILRWQRVPNCPLTARQTTSFWLHLRPYGHSYLPGVTFVVSSGMNVKVRFGCDDLIPQRTMPLGKGWKATGSLLINGINAENGPEFCANCATLLRPLSQLRHQIEPFANFICQVPLTNPSMSPSWLTSANWHYIFNTSVL